MVIKLLFGLTWILILVWSPPLCVFITIGLAPSFVSSIVNVKTDKNKSSTVFFFNLAGIVIPASRFMRTGLPSRVGEALNPLDLLVVYLFAAMGYIFVWLVPKITVIIVEYKSERRAIRIREKMAQLVEEWGAEVKNN